ncbi:MAG: multiubiquitin domain-containing protein [Alphaproteobacteria bacterium]|nr:multiubiquitin domain-containing protein [Alphaproteobacteria bacterium]
MNGFKYKVGSENYKSDEPIVTGYEILETAGIDDPDKKGLYQKLHGKKMERIKDLGAPIDLSAPGIEKFVVLPLDQTEGEAPPLANRLPPVDLEFLEILDLRWEIKAEGNVHWLVLYDFPLPEGYNHATSDVSLRLERLYPDTQIDMVYFGNSLSRKDGGNIRQLTSANHLGRTWQRWSRHRTPQNPWRPGFDCVETHLALVQQWLERELA